MNFYPEKWMRRGVVFSAAGVLALAVVSTGPARAQQQGQEQNQQQEQQNPPAQDAAQGQNGQGQGQSSEAPKNAQPQQPTPAPAPQQSPNRPPVTSRDRVPSNTPSPAAPDANQQPYYDPQGRPYDDQSAQPPYPQPPDEQGDQYGRPRYDRQYGYAGNSQQNGQYDAENGQPQHYAPPPSLLTIPAGTVVVIRTNEPLSSDHNQVGDQFTGTLAQPIVVGGYVVARRGQTIVGQVKAAKKAGRVSGTSQLGVELTDITLVDGTQAPILTELWKASGGTTHGADAATIAGGTVLGSAIGAAADWGRGAAIGAGAGAVAGIGAVLLTRGRPTILPAEAQLSFKLVDPVKVDTTKSASAFLPPTQQDFGSGRPNLRGPYGRYGPGPYGPGPYPYAYAPCGYNYPCYGYYGPYVGVYPWVGWGWYGPRYRRW